MLTIAELIVASEGNNGNFDRANKRILVRRKTIVVSVGVMRLLDEPI